MKLFLKFVISLVALPFLIPWFLADKVFEYLIQPFIFRKFHLTLARKKIWVMRIARLIVPALMLLFVVARTIGYFAKYNGSYKSFSFFKYLFIYYANGLIQGVNFLLHPVNQVAFYLQGHYIQNYWDFFLSFYLIFLPVIILASVVYRYLKTMYSIRRAIRLRNQAVRDVNIVRYAESAKGNELFLGLDLSKGGRPLYIKRDWLKGHTLVIGSSGTGKTESIIQPIWFQEVRRNVATIVLDGKASRKNIDKFFTIASSLAQGQDIYYFNPDDPERSASYNPLLHGSVTEVKQKIIHSINWAELSRTARERLDSALNIFLRTMEETGSYFNLRELLEFFQNREFVRQQSEKVNDPYLNNSLRDILMNYPGFQSNMSFFVGLLRDLFQSGYARLLNTNNPTIDIVDIYHGHRDCYFTLPMQSDETATRFLGHLILQDIQHCFQRIAMEGDSDKEGLLIIDEMAKFASSYLIDLLQASRNVGVSVCYTNQSLAELENPNLNLSKTFIDQLAENTNMVCCFQLGSMETTQMLLNRFSISKTSDSFPSESTIPGKTGTAAKTIEILNSDFLQNLDVGQCVLFIRRPYLLTAIKTGYFKFDRSLRFSSSGKQAPSAR